MNKVLIGSSSLAKIQTSNNMLQVLHDFTANENLFIPKLYSKTGQRSFQYREVHALNSLSVDARDYNLEQF